jgi:chromosome segregation ATPase
MSEADPALTPEMAERTSESLRQQVRELEQGLLAARAALLECAQQREMFETAAGERLAAILHGEALRKAQLETVAGLQEESAGLLQRVAELEARLAEVAAERAHWERRALQQERELARGMAELAERERNLTRENLELRNEGLLHSIIRRISSLLS